MNAKAETKSGDLVDATKTEGKDIATTTDGGGMLGLIDRMARNPEVTPEKLMMMLEVQERWESREAEKAFNQDFIGLQNALPEITEGGKILHNEKLISAYARWDEDINPVIKPILAEHNFTLSFETDTRDGIHVTAHLIHRDGHNRSGSFSLPPDTSGAKNNVQAVGSSVSYAKRYAAGPLLNITTRGMDDDARRAGMGDDMLQTITEKQAVEIREYLESTGSSKAKFLAWVSVEAGRKIESVGGIPARQRSACIAALKKKEHAGS